MKNIFTAVLTALLILPFSGLRADVRLNQEMLKIFERKVSPVSVRFQSPLRLPVGSSFLPARFVSRGLSALRAPRVPRWGLAGSLALAAAAGTSLMGCKSKDRHHSPCDSDPLSYECTPFNFNGAGGYNGQDGRDGSYTFPNGENGQNGGPGGDGRNITVNVTADASVSTVTVQVVASGYDQSVTYSVSELNGRRIQIRTEGGYGGKGGDGGDAHSFTDGALGGAGGNGGNGGDGGNVVIYASSALLSYVQIHNAKGGGGEGGKGGSHEDLGRAQDGYDGWSGQDGQITYNLDLNVSNQNTAIYPWSLIPPPHLGGIRAVPGKK